MRIYVFILGGIIFLVGLIWFFHFENNSIVITRLDISDPVIPAEFDGYTIVHLSDFHNQNFGPAPKPILDIVEKARPDLIAFTGDLIDSRKFHGEPALELMRGLVETAPVYYVNGNHEWASGHYPWLETQLRNLGVHVLRNSSETRIRGSAAIAVLGIDDPLSQGGGPDVLERELAETMRGVKPGLFTILLSHHPEVLPLYAGQKVRLVLTGHAHGGQFRLPLIGGLVAPDQGFFPRYTSGIWEEEQTKMVVHRGLGNSIIPIRLFNRPEVIIIRLRQIKENAGGIA